MKLIIEDDEGRRTVVPFARPEITLGRDEANTIRLTERNVSRKHARFVRVNGHVEIEDLQSYNGVRVNGERIQGKTTITDRDLIQIGDYDLAIEEDGVTLTSSPPASSTAVTSEMPPMTSTAPPPLPTPTEVPSEPALVVPPHLDPSNPRRQPTSVIRWDELEAERALPVHEIPLHEAPELAVLTTAFAGRKFPCLKTAVTIGRTEENDVAIDHRSLSRTHAKLLLEHGEWRVIDMQSANGVLVNGEGYAQATLRYGDVLELGHVKMRFEGPGGATAGPLSRLGGRKRWIPLIAIGVLVFFAGGVTLAMHLHPEDTSPTIAATETAHPAPAEPVPEPTLPQVVIHPLENETPVAAVPKPGPKPTARVPAVTAAKVKPREPSPIRVASVAATPDVSAHDQAERLYNDGKTLHKKQQLREAEQAFKRCLVLDPTFSRCHMMLGSTYALLKDFERGATHYRKFIEMSPDDAHAEQVRALLQKYDESIGPGKASQR